MFPIKINVKGYLNNITEQKKEQFDTKCIYNNHKYTYYDNETKHILTIKNNKEVILLRENNEFIHSMVFKLNEITKSDYYLKEYNHSLEFNIKTNQLEVANNKTKIIYQINETDNEYEYIIEMRD